MWDMHLFGIELHMQQLAFNKRCVQYGRHLEIIHY